jgi:DNA-binding transcriptional LysR family regulator
MLAMAMTLRQLEYFLAILDEGSITRAAVRLHIAQPSLSQQLRELERSVGGALVERLPRSIRLTALGEQFEPSARAVVLAAQEALNVARSALNAQTGELEIATVRSIAAGILPASINRWRGKYPDATVRLHEFGHRSTLEEQVRDGLADLAIGPHPQRWQGPVVSLGWEEFVIVLAPDDPAAQNVERIRLETLRDREWVLFEPEHGLIEVVKFACATADFCPKPAVQTAQVEAAARLAAAGLGPALIPADAVPSDLKHVAIPLDPPLGRELTAYARTEFTTLAHAYLAVLREDAYWSAAPPDVCAVP